MNGFLKDVIAMLKEEEGKDYSGQYTFAKLEQDENEYEWLNDAFPTKEQAVHEAAKKFPKGFVIGQLKSNGLDYDVENIEPYTTRGNFQ